MTARTDRRDDVIASAVHFWTAMPADSNRASAIAHEAVTVLLTVVNIVAADIAAAGIVGADIVGVVEFDRVDSGIADRCWGVVDNFAVVDSSSVARCCRTVVRRVAQRATDRFHPCPGIHDLDRSPAWYHRGFHPD